MNADEIKVDENGQPIRIQRRRTCGYDMQAESLKRNGLPCIFIGRPTKYGNPFKFSNARFGLSRDESLLAYRGFLGNKLEENPTFLEPLRGKNLACFCKENEKCHGDILLELANK